MSNYTKMAALMGSSAIVVGGGAAVADTDWSGPYAGATYSSFNGEVWLDFDSYAEWIFSGLTAPGGFIGHNWNAGNGMVFGTEIAMHGSFSEGPYAMNGLTDAKVRLGIAFGDALLYGVGGFSSALFVDDSVEFSPYTFALSGFNYGVGLDYAINDNAFVGIEYLARNMADAWDYATIEPLSSVSLRLGVNF